MYWKSNDATLPSTFEFWAVTKLLDWVQLFGPQLVVIRDPHVAHMDIFMAANGPTLDFLFAGIICYVYWLYENGIPRLLLLTPPPYSHL